MANSPFTQRRLAKGYSLEKLARASGISTSYATTISGGYIPRREVQERIAATLECTPVDLWPSVAEKVA